jgi:WD40 repeat protein
MAAAALAARVVEVIADLGAAADSRYRYGSGCIVHGRTVLTAAHVVAGAVSVVVRDPARREYTAIVDPQFVGDVDGPAPDLALLEIADPAFEGGLPPIGLAGVDRDSATGEPVERCHAIGYPWFAETPSPRAVRDTVDAIGVVPVLSKLKTGLLSVQVTVTPRELPPEETALGASEWSGMSGAPVLASACLLGVVTEHAPREGPSAIMAVPLTALRADPAHEQWGPGVADPAAWWSRLGVAGIRDLRRLPVPPPPRQPPPYRATLRVFGRTLHQRMPQLLGRERELREIAAFATGSDGYRRLVGGAFTGKTALLYEAVTVGLPDEVDAVCYFLSRRASDASSDRFLAAAVPQLAYLCDVDAPEANVDRYHALWEQAAELAAQSGRHLLLVVDGLDEDLHPPGSPSVASLLPTLAGAHTHVLVTSRPHPDLPNDVPDGHPLRVRPVPLDPFKGAQELAKLANKEIFNLTHGDDIDLAVEVLGLLTAASGPLSPSDLVALRSNGQGAPTAADTRHVRRLVEERAARSLERVGPAGKECYQFAHASLLEYAQTVPDLCEPEYRQRIHHWAERWRDAGWPSSADGKEGTPQYLLGTYPATVAHDPQRLAQLVCDIGWVEAAIASAGVDDVLAELRRAAAAIPANATVTAMLAIVSGQAYYLRRPRPVDQPGYILRQLCMQAREFGEDHLAHDLCGRLQSRPGPGLVLLWTTRRASRALSGELGRHDGPVWAVAAADGRVVTGGDDGRLLVWDPASPGANPVELGHCDHAVRAVAVLADGRVVTGGDDGRVLVWDPATPSADPLELGRHGGEKSGPRSMAVLADGRVVTFGEDGRVLVWDPAQLNRPVVRPVELGRHRGGLAGVKPVAVLADGRVVTGGTDRRVLVWDPASPGAPPVELGRHDGWVQAVAVLADGRVVTGGGEGRLLVWDPARPGAYPVELGRHPRVRSVAVLADGRLVTSHNDGRLLVWDLASPRAGPVELGRHDGWAWALAVLADGRVVTGGADGRVLVWDPARPSVGLIDHEDQNDEVRALVALTDGRLVTCQADGRVVVWDLASPGAGPMRLEKHSDQWHVQVQALAVLTDGRIVTVGDDWRVLVRDPAGPRGGSVELGDSDDDDSVQASGPLNAAAVLADGRVVTSGYDERLLLWDLASPGGGPVELGHYDVWAMAVLADGRVVTGLSDGRLLVWDPASLGVGPVELGHHDKIRVAAVLAEGRVVTGGDDGRLLVWDPASPGVGPVELGHHDEVRAVAVLADGRVVTGGDDGRLLVWDPACVSSEIMELGCAVAALAKGTSDSTRSNMVIAHKGNGLSLWSVAE